MKDVQVVSHIDTNVEPIAQKQRPKPFHLRQKVSAEVDLLEELKIIEKIKRIRLFAVGGKLVASLEEHLWRQFLFG